MNQKYSHYTFKKENKRLVISVFSIGLDSRVDETDLSYLVSERNKILKWHSFSISITLSILPRILFTFRWPMDKLFL